MGRTINTYSLGVFIFTLGISLRSAFGYPTPVDFKGQLLRWEIGPEDGPIYYEVTGDLNDVFEYEPVIAEAAALWSDVPTSYFSYASIDETEEGTKAKVSIELVRDFEGAETSAGYARFDEISGSGKPKHCEIKVAMGVVGIPKTILHELGHCFGLGHSLVPEAIMSYRDKENGFYLDTDDHAAISRLYPADGSSPKLPPGCAIAAGHTAANIGATLLVLLLPLFVAGLTCKRRTPINLI